MFERFSEEARVTVVRAQEEARLRGDRYLGTEHLLLGTIADRDGRGARLLRSCGITADQVRAAVGDAVDPSNRPVDGALTFTDSAQQALELAVHEAISLQRGVVGSDHLLIALANPPSSGSSEQDAASSRVLTALGVDADTLRTACGRMEDRETPEHSPQLPDPGRRVADQLGRLSKGPLRTDQLLGTLGGALDLAEEEAIYFGRPAADGGDLLVGLAAARDALVGRALAELGIDPERVRAAVQRAREHEPPV